MNSFNRYMNDGKRAMENDDYLRAAENFYNASKISEKLFFNKKAYVKSACKEADCYLLIALETDEEDISNKYYARAAGIYGNIIHDKRYKDTDYYADALAGLIVVYDFIGHELDEKWETLIVLMEKEVKKIDKIDTYIKNDNGVDEVPIYRWIKVYSTLAEHYYLKIITNYTFMYDFNTIKKALEYYENYDILINFVRERDEEIGELINPIYNAQIRVELMILAACFSVDNDMNPEQYVKEAIDLCQKYLNDASMSIKNDKESYVSFKLLVAKGYSELGKYYDKKGKRERSNKYMRKAYDEMIPLLEYEADEVPLTLIIGVGYDAIFTGFCSDENLKKILHNYRDLLSQIEGKPTEMGWYVFNICDACKGIIEIYGFSQEAWEMGQYITEEVKNIKEYVQEDQRINFNSYYNYFHQDTRKVIRNSIK